MLHLELFLILWCYFVVIYKLNCFRWTNFMFTKLLNLIFFFSITGRSFYILLLDRPRDWSFFLYFFKILLYLHYISGENAVLQILLMIMWTNVLQDKSNSYLQVVRITLFANRTIRLLTSMFGLILNINQKNKINAIGLINQSKILTID